MDPFVAEIQIFAGNFAPAGWALCNGQLMLISQNTALFSLLGTLYGGDGKSTFGLPNLQGQVAIGAGQGAGLSNFNQGDSGGTSVTVLSASQMPVHHHSFNAVSEQGVSSDPTGNYLGNTGNLDPEYTATGTLTPLNATAVGSAGGSQPFSNMNPYLGMSYIIAVQGVYPPRS